MYPLWTVVRYGLIYLIFKSCLTCTFSCFDVIRNPSRTRSVSNQWTSNEQITCERGHIYAKCSGDGS